MSKTDQTQVSDGELRRLVSELDQLHRDETYPALLEAVDEWKESLKKSSGEEGGPLGRVATRRRFLLGVSGATAGGLVLAAGAPASASVLQVSSHKLSGDLRVAAMAASLENLGVYAYNAGLRAATTGKLGNVPPAVATFATTAKRQHMDHAAAWNSVLTSARKKAVKGTDPVLTPTVKTKFAQVTNVTGLAKLALFIENIAAQTYQSGVSALRSSKAVAIAATIQPVEMQHAAILYFVLGQYPGIQGTAGNSYLSGSPLAFSPTSLARPPSDYQGS